MAGRGGRGGKSSSLTQEQLQAMGAIGKDVPSGINAPPPTFPPLLTKPVPLENSATQNYKILWKEDFLNHMRDSSYYLEPIKSSKNNIQRYSDKYVNVLENTKDKRKAEIPWQLMPSELSPAWKKRKNDSKSGAASSKKKKVEDIESHLKVLEEKEKNDRTEDAADKKATDSDNEEPENEIEEDDEMDDENDYGNSYFDNGEAYNEEDDNLDDGPVY